MEETLRRLIIFNQVLYAVQINLPLYCVNEEWNPILQIKEQCT